PRSPEARLEVSTATLYSSLNRDNQFACHIEQLTPVSFAESRRFRNPRSEQLTLNPRVRRSRLGFVRGRFFRSFINGDCSTWLASVHQQTFHRSLSLRRRTCSHIHFENCGRRSPAQLHFSFILAQHHAY